MHIKKRSNGRMSLYRSRYVRKGVDGNTHGYPVQTFVGSLRFDAQELPSELAAKLSPEEIEYIEKQVLVPARRAAEDSRRAAEASRRAMEDRERDPRWRLEEALRLVTDAAKLVSEAGRGIDATKVHKLGAALEELSVAAKVRRDPLDVVVAAITSATTAVKANHYGSAPNGKFRDTPVHKSWQRIREVVDSGDDSLLKALQAKGWAAIRG